MPYAPEWNRMFSRTLRNIAPPDFPTVVCLCGSTRFKDAWHAEAKRLTHEGKIVLSVGDLDQSEAARAVNVPLDPTLKVRLDALHFRKIEMSDEILVLNVGGYVGESPRNEIAHAY